MSDTLALPSYVLVTNKHFTPGHPYRVLAWNDGTPAVGNDSGSKTWLVDPAGWRPAPEPMSPARSLELLHAAYRARLAKRDPL